MLKKSVENVVTLLQTELSEDNTIVEIGTKLVHSIYILYYLFNAYSNDGIYYTIDSIETSFNETLKVRNLKVKNIKEYQYLKNLRSIITDLSIQCLLTKKDKLVLLEGQTVESLIDMFKKTDWLNFHE